MKSPAAATELVEFRVFDVRLPFRHTYSCAYGGPPEAMANAAPEGVR